ncbi:MAG: ATP-dependent DNA helicase [Actinomycetales bacterium]|nr:MAG: ATP-dependent DNA helicase [Actinomycetales bacterium]
MSRATLDATELAFAAGATHPPTDEQIAVIEAPADGSMLVVAGAGSGKTETMASRVVWLVANGFVAPDEVLGLTFTRKAAGELAERVALRLRRLQAAGLWVPEPTDWGAQALTGLPTISTYHAYAGRLVSEHALRAGIEPDARLLSEAAVWQFAAEAVLGFDTGGLPGGTPVASSEVAALSALTKADSTIIGAVVDLAAELAEHLCTTEDVRAEIDRVLAALDTVPPGGSRRRTPPLRDVRTALSERRAILPVIDAFTALKRSRDALDFADQVALAARLAREHPEIGAGERARYRVVLLDEFQDTSEAQLALLRDLFVAPDDRPGPDRSAARVSVTAVGDPHQAIYGWRGASSATLARFPAEFPTRTGSRDEPSCGRTPVLSLSTTWRNDRIPLAVANLVAEPLRVTARVHVQPLHARPEAQAGDVEVARLGTQSAEAAYLARWIRQARGRSSTTAAVLCRKRSQFQQVLEALEAEGLPVEVVGLGGLLLTPEVVDMVAFLQVVADPTRGDALMRLLTGPLCRLGAADLDGLYAWACFRHRRSLDGSPPERIGAPEAAVGDTDAGTAGRGNRLVDLAPGAIDEPSLLEAVEELPPPGWSGPEGERLDPVTRSRLYGLAAAIQRVRGLSGLPLPELVGEAERSLGLDVEVLARPEYPPAVARIHLDAFTDVAAGFAAGSDQPTLAAFLGWLEAAEQQERGLDMAAVEPSPEAVQVLTVHAAKGLEWDVVAVPGLVEGTFPTWRPPPRTKPSGRGWHVDEPALSGWTRGLAGLPYALRGDHAALPVFEPAGAVDRDEIERRYEAFRVAEGQRAIDEERRLAYVAMTRARHRLLLTAPVWLDAATPRVTSRFLVPIHERAESFGVRVGPWEPLPEPADDLVNPVLEQQRVVLWPADHLADRRALLEQAEAAVARARQERAGQTELPVPIDESDLAADVATLLAERRAEREPPGSVVDVPGHLSASEMVRLAADPRGFAMARRRPLPEAPDPMARRGTAFHAWVEQHYGQAALLEVTELPGAADDSRPDTSMLAPDAPDGADDLAMLIDNFRASEWATRTPIEIETAVETVIDGMAVRSRIDAVFARPDGGVTVVDWKTGVPPDDSAKQRAAAVQLAVYALAYARVRGLPPEHVDAAFFYARTGQTVRPPLPGIDELTQVLAQIRP